MGCRRAFRHSSDGGPLWVPSVSLSHIRPRRNESSHGVGVSHRRLPEFAEVVKAHVTIEAAKRAHTNEPKKVTFDGAAPMRTRGLDASAVGAIAFHNPSTPKSDRTRSLAEPRTPANSQAGASQGVLGSEEIIPTNADSGNTENRVSRFIASYPHRRLLGS